MVTWINMSNWTQFKRSKCKSGSSCKNSHSLVRTKMIVTTITHCCSANTIHRRLSQHLMLTRIMIMTMMEIMREIIISSVMRILLWLIKTRDVIGRKIVIIAQIPHLTAKITLHEAEVAVAPQTNRDLLTLDQMMMIVRRIQMTRTTHVHVLRRVGVAVQLRMRQVNTNVPLQHPSTLQRSNWQNSSASWLTSCSYANAASFRYSTRSGWDYRGGRQGYVQRTWWAKEATVRETTGLWGKDNKTLMEGTTPPDRL